MKHLVQLSGGVGSYMAARRVIEQYGSDDVVLLFADTHMEDEDLYRFLDDVEVDLGIGITRLADGRTPWDVFADVRYIGNTRVDPCSRVLKRDLLRAHMDEQYDPERDVVYLGIDWSEEHRFEAAKSRWTPWEIRAPLCERPLLDKADMLAELEQRGIEVPRLYEMGFPHNNCGGFCIKQGQAGFKQLLEEMPERFAWHEQREQELRQELGDVAILRDRTREGRAWHFDLDDWVPDGQGGLKPPNVAPLTLRELRRRVQEGTDDTDPFDDLGGCSCMT